MKYVSELGPAIVEWNHESAIVDCITMTCKAVEGKFQTNLGILFDSCNALHKKDVLDAQYIELCLQYYKKVKVKKIPFFISFIGELKNPKPAVLFIRTMLESQKNKKLNTLVVGPLKPFLKDKKRKEFYFSGFAYWNLITMK